MYFNYLLNINCPDVDNFFSLFIGQGIFSIRIFYVIN